MSDRCLLQAAGSADTVARLQGQVQQAKQLIEQLETDREIAIAEVGPWRVINVSIECFK